MMRMMTAMMTVMTVMMTMYDDDGNGKIGRYIGEFYSLPVNVGVNTNVT